jgi:hypothetical protein
VRLLPPDARKRARCRGAITLLSGETVNPVNICDEARLAPCNGNRLRNCNSFSVRRLDRRLVADRPAKRPEIVRRWGAATMNFLERLRQAKAETARRDADPLRGVVETTVRGMDAVSTVALLDLIGLPKSTGNARRVSQTMRSLGFVPIKSRRLMPGGHLNTVTRGWARPLLGAAASRPKKPTGPNFRIAGGTNANQ